ncbi:MAG: L-histidine N(alpha)-methyltransferase [Anaerolineae bacterium]
MRQQMVFCDRETLEQRYVAEFLRTKRVPQNLFYIVDGATSFYSYRDRDLAKINWRDEYRFFERQPFWSEEQSIVLISLGCGNAGPEKPLLRAMNSDGYQVDYVGVDSSQAMLELAAENLAGQRFDQTFVLGDFGQQSFRDDLSELVAGYDVRVFAMMGGTLGNFDQVWIADVLQDLLCPGDHLYLDVVPMYGSDEENVRLRSRFADLPQNLGRFFDDLLRQLGLSRSDGKMVSDEGCDDDLNSMCITFYFEATDPLVFSCAGEDAKLERGERIELLSIRAYDVPSLKAFFEQRGFKFVDTFIPDVGDLSHLWQRLLFQKKRGAQ